MAIIIVGAGAIGQVYGHHLARGGAEVGVLVRPRRRAAAAAGYTLTRIVPLLGRRTERFVPRFVVTSAPELAGVGGIEQLWFCVPTNDLDDALVRDLAQAVPAATIVVLAPGHFVRDRIHRLVGPARAVFGAIGMISYVSPLEGSSDPRETATEPGLAYLLSPTKLSSASESRALDAVTALRLGGCPCDLVNDAIGDVALGTASLMPSVVALEIAGWSFRRYREEESSQLAARATRESITIAASVVGRSEPTYAQLVSPFLLRSAVRLVPLVSPLDMESFLRVHFAKVGEQTRLLVSTSIDDGQRLGLPTDAQRELLAKLDETRSSA